MLKLVIAEEILVFKMLCDSYAKLKTWHFLSKKVNKIKHYKGKIMGTQVFLGPPPPHIEAWIKAHSKPAGNPMTKITFTDGSVKEYDWSGKITSQMMVDAGLFN